MSDDLSKYEDEIEREEAAVEQLEDEEELSDAEELVDLEAEGDETAFDATRYEYSGVEADDDGDVDVQELAEAGALLDDPERMATISGTAGGTLDDPDGVDDPEVTADDRT